MRRDVISGEFILRRRRDDKRKLRAVKNLRLKLEFCKICHSEALFVPQGLSRSLKVFLIEGIAEESALKQQILRGVYPRAQVKQILRSAQNDKRRAQDDKTQFTELNL